MSELSKKLGIWKKCKFRRLDNEKWNSVWNMNYSRMLERKNFLLSVAIGYKAGIKLELKESCPTINFSGISEERNIY